MVDVNAVFFKMGGRKCRVFSGKTETIKALTPKSMQEIRVQHEFVQRLDKSVSGVTVWHHLTGQICLSYPQTRRIN